MSARKVQQISPIDNPNEGKEGMEDVARDGVTAMIGGESKGSFYVITNTIFVATTYDTFANLPMMTGKCVR